MSRTKNPSSPAAVSQTKLAITLLVAVLALAGAPSAGVPSPAGGLERQTAQDETTEPSPPVETRHRVDADERPRPDSDIDSRDDLVDVLPGTLKERVIPKAAPDQVYALYLPSSYSSRSPAPVLYLLDARGRAMLPLERFRPAAERLGWILASSWTSASDGPFQPNLDAARAMWQDTHERLAVAEKRAYAAGFSGTARAAVALAMLAPGSLTGVIASGAGFPPGTEPDDDLPFLYFAAVGATDFNYWEVLDLEEELQELGSLHRVTIFDGGHEWMPTTVAATALEWMEVQALRRGGSDAAPEVVEEAWQNRWERARKLEKGDETWRAWRLYTAMAEDFAGLRDVKPAVEAAQRLGRDPDLEVERELRPRLRAEEEEALERAERILAEALAAAERRGLHPERTAARLRLSDWLERSAEKGPRGESSRRVLAKLRVQLGFYLPREAEAQGRPDRAAFLLELAERLAPDAEPLDGAPR